jgi:hypothetical protein
MVLKLDNKIATVSAFVEKLTYCPPSYMHPKDLSEATHNAKIGKDSEALKKYYASETINIDGNTTIPFSILEKINPDASNLLRGELEKYTSFLGSVFGLIELNDVCDKVGIEYLATFFAHYCGSYSDNLLNLNEGLQTAVTAMMSSDVEVVKIAKMAGECGVADTYV